MTNPIGGFGQRAGSFTSAKEEIHEIGKRAQEDIEKAKLQADAVFRQRQSEIDEIARRSKEDQKLQDEQLKSDLKAHEDRLNDRDVTFQNVVAEQQQRQATENAARADALAAKKAANALELRAREEGLRREAQALSQQTYSSASRAAVSSTTAPDTSNDRNRYGQAQNATTIGRLDLLPPLEFGTTTAERPRTATRRDTANLDALPPLPNLPPLDGVEESRQAKKSNHTDQKESDGSCIIA